MMGDIVLTSTFWILGLGGVLLLVADTFFKGQWPRALATAVVLVGAVGAPLATSDLYVPGLRVFYGMVHADTFALFTGVLLVLGALMVIIMGLNRVSDEGIEAPGEYYALLLMSTAGAVLFANASELITMFLGLEILSMALYCLCGSATSRRESSESSLKYFLLGSFSSAFLLYGIALL